MNTIFQIMLRGCFFSLDSPCDGGKIFVFAGVISTDRSLLLDDYLQYVKMQQPPIEILGIYSNIY